MESSCNYANTNQRDCLMGPYSEQRQIERAEAVARLLSDPNLNDWAKNYWSRVAQNLSMSEEQYNARVVALFTGMRNERTKRWMDE